MPHSQKEFFSVLKAKVLHEIFPGDPISRPCEAVITLIVDGVERKESQEGRNACDALLKAFAKALPEVSDLLQASYPKNNEDLEIMVENIASHFRDLFRIQQNFVEPFRSCAPVIPGQAAACPRL